MSQPPFQDDDDEEPTFFQAHQPWIVLGAVAVLAGGAYLGFSHQGSPTAPPKPERITMVQLPPPPPPKPKPVPTPPPVEKPPEQKPVETKDRMEDAPKLDAPKPEPVKAPDEPPPSMGSNIKGDGPDSFGLSGSGNGGFVGLGGKGGGGGNGYARYGAQIQTRLAEALRQDKRTRAAAFSGKIRLWLDQSGKVTRAEPAARGDSGTELAAAVMVGQRLFDGLPAGLPMPVTVRPSASRPR